MSKVDLEVTTSSERGIQIVTLDGPVDSATYDTLKSALDPHCNKPGSKVLLDCELLTYVNSRAIGLFVKYHRSLSLSRGRLAFCAINKKVVRSLELLQLGKALQMYPTREEALAALSE